MALKTLEWASTVKLSCAGCNPADVYLCVNPEKIAQKECAGEAEDPTTNFEWKTIDGSVLSYIGCASTDGCGGYFYRYLINYDDVQLIEGAELLTSDIYSALCKGCLTDWVLSAVGNEVTVEVDEGTIVLVSQHGCRYPLDQSGLYSFNITADTGPVQEVVDGNTVIIAGGTAATTVVSAPDTVTINVDISTDGGNVISVGGDGGIYAPPVDVISVDADNLIIAGSDGGAYVSCSSVSSCLSSSIILLEGDSGPVQGVGLGSTITLIGGDSITTVASDFGNVTIDLEISTDADNIATLGTDGNVYVPSAIFAFEIGADSGLPETVNENDTVMILGGLGLATTVAPTDTITIDVEISTDADNTLVEGTDGGLYVPGVTGTNPTGMISMFGGAAAPAGWLLCDGDDIDRTTFAPLFTVIGVTFGIGDGVTTFNIPDLRQRFPLGKAASGTGVTLGSTGGAIDHTHSVPAHFHAMGTGADLAITSSGSHLHTINHDHPSGLTSDDGLHSHTIDHDHPQTLTSTDGAHTHFCVNSNTGNTPLSSSNYLAHLADYPPPLDRFSYDFVGRTIAADIGLTTSNGAHNHFFDVPAYTGSSGSAGVHNHSFDVVAFTGNSGSTSHTHAAGDFSGRIGLVTGGVDGNAAMTSGTSNPPYQVVNYIIKT